MEAIFQALSDAVPERAIAASGILQPFSIAAVRAPYWIHLSYDFGGVGARRGKDGPDATGVHFGIGRNSVPQAEPVETRCPLIVESVETVPDSGGPGRHRGGLGSRTVLRFLADAHVTTRGDRLRTPPRAVPAAFPAGSAASTGGGRTARWNGSPRRSTTPCSAPGRRSSSRPPAAGRRPAARAAAGGGGGRPARREGHRRGGGPGLRRHRAGGRDGHAVITAGAARHDHRWRGDPRWRGGSLPYG
nr:hypothetical protein GCM10020093_110200 [Planobispora longispora]